MRNKQIIFASLFVCALLSTAAAQNSTSLTAQSPSLTITAMAAGDRVRITAPSSVVQMRLEVYAASGEKLFDQEIRGGNVFDWHLQDGQAQRLAPGSYVCVITAKSVSGKLTQKIGNVSVAEKSVSVQPAESQQFSATQAQTIGPVEENSSWTIPGKDGPQTTTVIAHDGTDGQMIRGRGALTFRIGNFFTGNDSEQMRLTEDGRLGIGTNDPRATLDVAGTIRAQRVLIAKPISSGSDRKTQAGISATDTLVTDSDDFQPLLTGTGTQDRIAKWIDNAGTLGDSGITETGAGLVGIGTTAPGSKLVVSLNGATLPPAAGLARFADADGVQTSVFVDAFGNNPLFNVRRANGTAAAPSAVQVNQLLGVFGAAGYGASAYTGTRARVGFSASENWTDTANGTHLTFNTTANGAATAGGTERMRIDNNGNVGIGVTNPGEKLDVVGNVKASSFIGPLTGNVTGNASGSAASFTGSLVGDVTGTQGATVVSTVGLVTAANVAAGANLANAATSANTANTIVKRDASGNFSAGTITGSGAGLTNLNATNITAGTLDNARLGTVPIANGGTGATTAANARTNLGLGTLATVSPTGTANATTFLRGDNTWAAPGGGSSPFLSARATNLILTSGTYVDVISISLEAGKTYFIESLVLGQRVGAVSGNGTFHLVYSGAATTDFGFFVAANYLPDTVIDSTPSFDLEANGTPANIGATQGQRYELKGYLRTTSAGMLTIRGARASTNTTVDLNIREGTYLIATPLN